MAAHQQNVPGFQMIGFSFYVIRHFAGKKHNDLVKIVIVIGKCPVLPVTEMKKPELLVEIAGFFHCSMVRDAQGAVEALGSMSVPPEISMASL